MERSEVTLLSRGELPEWARVANGYGDGYGYGDGDGDGDGYGYGYGW